MYEKINNGEKIPRIKEVNDKPVNEINIFYQEFEIKNVNNNKKVIKYINVMFLLIETMGYFSELQTIKFLELK